MTFSNNKIEIIENNFQNENLIELDLSKNQIKFISKSAFYGVSNLQFLNLAHNQLTTLNTNIFYPTLTETCEAVGSRSCSKPTRNANDAVGAHPKPRQAACQPGHRISSQLCIENICTRLYKAYMNQLKKCKRFRASWPIPRSDATGMQGGRLSTDEQISVPTESNCEENCKTQ